MKGNGAFRNTSAPSSLPGREVGPCCLIVWGYCVTEAFLRSFACDLVQTSIQRALLQPHYRSLVKPHIVQRELCYDGLRGLGGLGGFEFSCLLPRVRVSVKWRVITRGAPGLSVISGAV